MLKAMKRNKVIWVSMILLAGVLTLIRILPSCGRNSAPHSSIRQITAVDSTATPKPGSEPMPVPESMPASEPTPGPVPTPAKPALAPQPAKPAPAPQPVKPAFTPQPAKPAFMPQPATSTSTPRTNEPGLKSANSNYIESIFVQKKCPTVTASVGTVAFPVFVIDFPDVKYTQELASKEELEAWIFGDGENSAASYYHRSSYGRTHLKGDVYFYTAQNQIKYYESYEGIEWLIMEALNAYDPKVDFSQYDANGDRYLDTLMITVPTYENIGFWWAVTPTWGEDPKYQDYRVDNTALLHYIINDFQPYASQRTDWIQTLEHELGHSMGLPDYYKYENYGDDSKGMHGNAGVEMMDDSRGDFCQFSKLLLGWLREDQVQIMPSNAKEQTFSLPPAGEGGCVLVFPNGKKADFQSEYFLIEYQLPTGNNKGQIGKGGVRVLHVQAEINPKWDLCWVEYLHKYNNYSPYYDTTNKGIRLLKLVNDGKDFYRTGDVVTYGASNFGWYDKNDQQKITDPGFSIRVGNVQKDGRIQITVRRTES